MNVFIHRRDIRNSDNITLNKMYQYLKEPIVPIFIFTPEQIDTNHYFSNNLLQFLCGSLVELNNDYETKGGHLHIYKGKIETILNQLHKEFNIKSIGFNYDYSPYSKKRDKLIEQWTLKHNIKLFNEEDMLLVDITKEPTYPNKEPYKKFTPFMRYQKINYKVSLPKTLKIQFTSFPKRLSIELKTLESFFIFNENIHVNSGRKEGLKQLSKLKYLKDYVEKRNLLTYQTSNLSAYINLGILSIREVYKKGIQELGDGSFIDELYWRDFYYNILYHYPHVVGNSFNTKYDKIKWNKNKKIFDKWCNGVTGFPIVDACMRQLNTTGYMHNRGRMIVASFLTKDLLIDWRWGEKYFATQLVDYNISANNGGWQWAAGSGTDAQPYFRIFNPWRQNEKCDPECIYIKRWIPELKEVDKKIILKWYSYNGNDISYPKPIVDHNVCYKNALETYKKYL